MLRTYIDDVWTRDRIIMENATNSKTCNKGNPRPVDISNVASITHVTIPITATNSR